MKSWYRRGSDQLGLFAVFAFAAMPLLALFIRHVQIFDLAHEFVAYRIGDAMSLMFRDAEAVHPVQGIPNALLSKAITYALYGIYGTRLVEPAILQLYAAIFFVVAFALMALAVVVGWPAMTWPQRAGLAMLAILPWHLSPTATLLAAPEYWFAEYAFLVSSLAGLAILRRRVAISDTLVLLVGAWAGLGVAIKLSLLGAVPFFFLALPIRSWKLAVLFVLGAVASYLLLLALYAGFRPSVFFDMLQFQVLFYLKPNYSATYRGPISAIVENVHLIAILTAAGMLCLLTVRNWTRSLAGLLWIGLLLYLIYKRPHVTSVASANLAGMFMIAYYAGQLRSIAIPVAATVVLCLTPAFILFPHLRWTGGIEGPPPFEGDILFLPDNHWNVALPAQAFGYNGQLALRPARLSNGVPTVHAPAFHALFERPRLLLGGSEYELSVLQAGLKHGMTVVWTRPPDRTDPAFTEALAAAGAVVTEQPTQYRGRLWYFGRAEVPAKQ